MMALLVSVVIMAYNRKRYLPDAINSVLSQTISPVEVEVIVIKNFTDVYIDNLCVKRNIKNIVMEGTIGEYIARGIIESSGKLIAFLDDDDLFSVEKLEHLKKYREEYGCDFIRNDYMEIDNQGNLLDGRVMKKMHLNWSLDSNRYLNSEGMNAGDIRGLLKMSMDFNLSTMAITKDLGLRIIKEMEIIEACPDGALFFLSLNAAESLLFVKEKLSLYRIHSSKSQEYRSVHNFLINSVRDGKAQIESLKKILPFLYKAPVVKTFNEMLDVRYIRISALSPNDENSRFITVNVIRSIVSLNRYAMLWTVLLFTSKILHYIPLKILFIMIGGRNQ